MSKVQRQNKRGQQVIAATPQHEREIDCKVFSPIVPASDLPSINNKSTTYKYDPRNFIQSGEKQTPQNFKHDIKY